MLSTNSLKSTLSSSKRVTFEPHLRVAFVPRYMQQQEPKKAINRQRSHAKRQLETSIEVSIDEQHPRRFSNGARSPNLKRARVTRVTQSLALRARNEDDFSTPRWGITAHGEHKSPTKHVTFLPHLFVLPVDRYLEQHEPKKIIKRVHYTSILNTVIDEPHPRRFARANGPKAADVTPSLWHESDASASVQSSEPKDTTVTASRVPSGICVTRKRKHAAWPLVDE